MKNRIHYLDSVRGIAALMVAVFHFINWRWSETPQVKAATFIFNGSDAVSFFFVLSGFVLSYAYVHRGRTIRFWNYLKKRVLRLYPAFVVNILLLWLYHNRNNLRTQNLYDSFVLNKGTRVWNELAMVLNVHDLYLPGWTLRIEMIYSILILGLILIITKARKEWLIPVWIASLFIGEPHTRMCMTHFILGILFCLYYPKLIEIDFKKTKFYPFRWLIYGLIFLLFSLRHFRKWEPVRGYFDYMWSKNIFWEHWSALAAFGILLLLATSKNAQLFLEKKTLLFFGKISYSIYLIHWLFVIFVMDRWDLWVQYIPNATFRFVVLFTAFMSATIGTATLLYKYIEVPFINFSKGRGFSTKE